MLKNVFFKCTICNENKTGDKTWPPHLMSLEITPFISNTRVWGGLLKTNVTTSTNRIRDVAILLAVCGHRIKGFTREGNSSLTTSIYPFFLHTLETFGLEIRCLEYSGPIKVKNHTCMNAINDIYEQWFVKNKRNFKCYYRERLARLLAMCDIICKIIHERVMNWTLTVG